MSWLHFMVVLSIEKGRDVVWLAEGALKVWRYVYALPCTVCSSCSTYGA